MSNGDEMIEHLRKKEQACQDRKDGKAVNQPAKKYWWENDEQEGD
jgi:hypothetical protein